MKEITVSFTPDELEALIQRVFVGEYVMASDEEKSDDKGFALLQKLLPLAESNKVMKDISKDELDGAYLVPYEMEEELITRIDEYEQGLFINTLLDELIANAMKEKYAPRLLANMTEEVYENKSAEFEEKFLQEIEKNDLANLRLQVKEE
jgi:hypothetical protein